MVSLGRTKRRRQLVYIYDRLLLIRKTDNAEGRKRKKRKKRRRRKEGMGKHRNREYLLWLSPSLYTPPHHRTAGYDITRNALST